MAELKDRGLLNSLLLSQHRNRKPNLQRYGGPGYSDLINRFLPMLRDRGISDDDIETLIVNNPSTALRIREMQ